MQSLSPEWKSRNHQGAPRDVQPPRKTQAPPVSNRVCLPLGGEGPFPGAVTTGHSQGTIQLKYQAFRVPRKGAPASRHYRAQISVTSEGCAVTSEPPPCHRCPVTVSHVPVPGPALSHLSSVSLPPTPEAFPVTQPVQPGGAKALTPSGVT